MASSSSLFAQYTKMKAELASTNNKIGSIQRNYDLNPSVSLRNSIDKLKVNRNVIEPGLGRLRGILVREAEIYVHCEDDVKEVNELRMDYNWKGKVKIGTDQSEREYMLTKPKIGA